MSDLQVAIYFIRDSDGAIRYVGKSRLGGDRRLLGHLRRAARQQRTHFEKWLRTLDAPPRVEDHEWVVAEQANDRERYWIARFREEGQPLTNGTAGGDGGDPGPEGRRKLSEWRKGRPVSAETRARLHEAHKGQRSPTRGKVWDAAYRMKMSASMKRATATPEARARLAANGRMSLGRKHSPEAKAKMSAARFASRSR